jgi:hypothetical protein
MRSPKLSKALALCSIVVVVLLSVRYATHYVLSHWTTAMGTHTEFADWIEKARQQGNRDGFEIVTWGLCNDSQGCGELYVIAPNARVVADLAAAMARPCNEAGLIRSGVDGLAESGCFPVSIDHHWVMEIQLYYYSERGTTCLMRWRVQPGTGRIAPLGPCSSTEKTATWDRRSST